MESNPYQAPGSPANEQPPPAPRRPEWKAYFAIVICLELASVLAGYARYSSELATFVGLTVKLLSLLGLFGYCFGVRIGSPAAWRIIAPVIVVWDAFQLLINGESILRPGDWTPFGLLALAIVALFALPLYVALFRYAFADDPLWHRTD